MRELKNVEERILDRALYLMGVNKTCDISIRAIAKEAQVNVSAINYYFRSKEEMLRLVKEFYIENTLTVSAILSSDDLGCEEKLILAANEIMEYSQRFPGNMVILRDAKRLADTDEVSRKIVGISAEVGLRLSELLDEILVGDAISKRYKYVIFMSAVNYPTEYDGIEYMGDIPLGERTERIAYLRLLLDSLKAQG
ncbi:TetR family transcriptional regulator [Gorillibacterium sp. sgz500922]|uniref:TetR family transcriptional regulator n=1 Tax=Gorillibacterium sp. sgz500922 TaxID=3446694 RepID=UPI003F6746C9